MSNQATKMETKVHEVVASICSGKRSESNQLQLDQLEKMVWYWGGGRQMICANQKSVICELILFRDISDYSKHYFVCLTPTFFFLHLPDCTMKTNEQNFPVYKFSLLNAEVLPFIFHNSTQISGWV